MTEYWLITIILCYLALLFYIAYWGEKNTRSKLVQSPYIYALSLAVYCSAWTYYGSVGVAARTGIEFLAIYLGPVIAAPLWIFLLKKITALSKLYNVSSLADFISIRYGNNRSLGALVAIVCAISIIPYIALQLKAVSETFQIITNTSSNSQGFIFDTTFYIAIILAVFASFFGTLSLDASRKKNGVILAVTFESILKLTFFVAIGIYVTFYIFDGGNDIIHKVSQKFDIHQLSTLADSNAGINWYFMIVLSFLAIFLLPRQFQTSVVEFSNQKQLSKAIWVFPLYLLIFNIFVIFIAWGGLYLFGREVNADYMTLWIPLEFGHDWLAVLVFLGGFSAVISMVVISTLALSTMLSNNLIIPYGFLNYFQKKSVSQNEKNIKRIRRISIFSLIFIAYILYAFVNPEVSLFNIGLVSFLIIAQLAPSFFLGLFWNRGSALASKVSIISGVLVVIYTYFIPFVSIGIFNNYNFVEQGIFGISALKPQTLFGVQLLSPVNHSLFWSLLVNGFLFVFFSVAFKGNYRERNYGEVFVNSSEALKMKESAYVWKGEAYISDIQKILERFLGEKHTSRAINIFKNRYKISDTTQLADAKFINFSEKLLTGTVGGASAKILISSVAKEKPISLVEVLDILEENKETIAVNKSLEKQSETLTQLTDKLKTANEALRVQDQMKDDFLDTVAHELKTPITSIQAASEILQDEDLPMEIQKKFLENIMEDTQRLTRLINSILNLEKLASGRTQLHLDAEFIDQTLQKSVESMANIAKKEGKSIDLDLQKNLKFPHDFDKMTQVFINLLTNALKHTENIQGQIEVSLYSENSKIICIFQDNGVGVAEHDSEHIFKKFYQSQNQTLKKPIGSGLGLAICKQIIELHHGQIYLDKNYREGSKFIITFEKNDKQNG